MDFNEGWDRSHSGGSSAGRSHGADFRAAGEPLLMLTKSSSELVRRQNRALVLEALRRDGPQSHTDLGLATGLSSATVSAITRDLEREAVIEKAEGQPAGARGRPRILFRQRRDAAHAAFLRISSDVVQYSMVDYSGTLIDRFDERRETGSHEIDDFAATLKTGLAKLAARSQVGRETLLAVSVSSKGLVADDNATLLWSAVLGDRTVDFRSVLSTEWDARITLDNESLLVASALHARRVRDRPLGRIAALSLGHSIGLGVVHAETGQALATAPNFGHMIHMPEGALCRCGSHGCIEAYAGFYAILRTAFEVPPNTLPARFVPFVEVEKLAARARRGDRMAEFAFRQAGTALGTGLGRLMSLHGRMPVVITGPGVRLFDLMRPGLDEALKASMGVRIEGPPEMTVSMEEDQLVFEGQLQQTLETIDRDVIAAKARVQGGA